MQEKSLHRFKNVLVHYWIIYSEPRINQFDQNSKQFSKLPKSSSDIIGWAQRHCRLYMRLDLRAKVRHKEAAPS